VVALSLASLLSHSLWREGRGAGRRSPGARDGDGRSGRRESRGARARPSDPDRTAGAAWRGVVRDVTVAALLLLLLVKVVVRYVTVAAVRP